MVAAAQWKGIALLSGVITIYYFLFNSFITSLVSPTISMLFGAWGATVTQLIVLFIVFVPIAYVIRRGGKKVGA